MSPPRITVETWDPEYGSPILDVGIEPSDAAVDVSVEMPASQWRPISPPSGTTAAQRVVFVDGVRRIEALAWISESEDVARRGICASFAAAVVEASDRARIGTSLA